jgi:hypothetical protein
MKNNFKSLSKVGVGNSYSGEVMKEMTAAEKFRQYSKWYNLSSPAICKLLAEAADEIEKLTVSRDGWKNTAKTATARVMELSKRLESLNQLVNQRSLDNRT